MSSAAELPMDAPIGRYIVTRHWRTRWKVQDQSWNPPKDIGRTYDREADAQAAADRLNQPPAPPQRPQQTSLFDQEVNA